LFLCRGNAGTRSASDVGNGEGRCGGDLVGRQSGTFRCRPPSSYGKRAQNCAKLRAMIRGLPLSAMC
jgi:hypothetical protein